MTMFSLPHFCRVCLKYDKNLIDLEHIENEPNETLISKLQQCVSEVEWSLFKPLLCHPCIKRLNNAYTFKKQCVQSATVLKSYMALVKENKKKNESQGTSDGAGSGNAYMMLPNQKYIKIVVGPNTPANSFQNVFLNVVPTTASGSSDSKSSKDTNQNVFLNINSTFQKFIPITSESKEKNLNVSQLLTESKTEELSVELDPTDFSYAEGDSSGDEENGGNDWEELISQSQIAPRSNGSTQNGNNTKLYGNYVPILPKTNDDNFLNSGQHFLSTSQNFSPNSDVLCELCQKTFHSVKLLKFHIREFHLGKYPFKCEYCYSEFVLRGDYESCLKSHKTESDALTNSITLGDFKNTMSIQGEGSSDQDPLCIETSDVVCELCNKQFNSSSGLARHKVRKHNQKSKKKYFIKGMKNARCDICNREFSTQSYMQLHRKLHLRDDIGYKYKVFSKNRYAGSGVEQQRVEIEAKIKTNSESDEEKSPKLDNQNEGSNNGVKLEEEDEDEEMDVEESDEAIKSAVEVTEQCL